MKYTFKTLLLAAMLALPFTVNAADNTDSSKADAEKTQKTTSKPPQDVTTYPCWDAMQDGHMMHMHGMMDGHMQTPPQGVKAHTCWDVMQNGQKMHMHNMHMMWNGAPTQSKQ